MVPNLSNGIDLLETLTDDPNLMVIAVSNFYLSKYKRKTSYLKKSAALGYEPAIKKLQKM
jgi:hypothetical protein